jgi:GDP-L-fucose synthase
MHRAKVEGLSRVELWGSGEPKREFVFADDLADACLFVMREYDDVETPINLGCGADLSIRETAELIRRVVGFAGELVFDATKPDGMPKKSLDSTRLAEMGWRANTPIATAVAQTYEAFLQHERHREREHVRIAV